MIAIMNRPFVTFRYDKTTGHMNCMKQLQGEGDNDENGQGNAVPLTERDETDGQGRAPDAVGPAIRAIYHAYVYAEV